MLWERWNRIETIDDPTAYLFGVALNGFRMMKTFSTKGAEKRKQHGSKGATVFRDPNEDNRVWVLFDWDQEGWQNFVSDPEVPAIFQEAGSKGKPQAAEVGGQFDA